MAFSLKDKPNNTYYQMDNSSFDKRGVKGLKNAFSGERFQKRRFLFMGENKNTSPRVPKRFDSISRIEPATGKSVG